MNKVIQINDESFDSEVLVSDVPVVVDFMATWCGPCKSLSPVLDKLAEEKGGSLKVCKLDIDEAPEKTSKYGVRGVPTLMVFKDGKPVATSVGLATKEKILKLIP